SALHRWLGLRQMMDQYHHSHLQGKRLLTLFKQLRAQLKARMRTIAQRKQPRTQLSPMASSTYLLPLQEEELSLPLRWQIPRDSAQ
ncbi:MAG: hypothetical protein AAB209_12035, partial [Bacteroidota bacterium]